MRIPEPTKPSLSGYVTADQRLPWPWVDARMEQARNYWITTHSPSFPSSRPVWGIWRSPLLWFSSGSAIARHIERNALVQANLESGDEVVVIEGEARALDIAYAREWASNYNQKYHWDMPESNQGVFELTPTRVLAWLCDSTGLDGGAGFSNSATEWRFD